MMIVKLDEEKDQQHPINLGLDSISTLRGVFLYSAEGGRLAMGVPIP